MDFINQESESFSWFDEDHKTIIPLQVTIIYFIQMFVIMPSFCPKKTKLYTEDGIGLKTLDDAGKLHFMSVEVF